MPNNTNLPPTMPDKSCCGGQPPSSGRGCGCGGFGKKIMLTLLSVLVVYLVFYIGTAIRNNLKKFEYIGKADKTERTITINGYGKVTGRNDIAVTSLGYANTNKDVGLAQAENKKVMDQVMNELKKLGIDDKDLRTDYSIHPDYNYTQEKGQELLGYRVSNSVTVKIRDLGKISDILSLAGKYGATEVSGLNFTIDEPENLKAQARNKALLDAKVKATRLAALLGLRLVSIVAYNEYEGGNEYPVPVMRAEEGVGGGGGPAVVESGSKEVVMNVSITYEIAP